MPDASSKEVENFTRVAQAEAWLAEDKHFLARLGFRLTSLDGTYSIHEAAPKLAIGREQLKVALYLAKMTNAKGNPTRRAIDRGLLVWKILTYDLKGERLLANKTGEEVPFYRVVPHIFMTLKGLVALNDRLLDEKPEHDGGLSFMNQVKVEVKRRYAEKLAAKEATKEATAKKKKLMGKVVDRADVTRRIKNIIQKGADQ